MQVFRPYIDYIKSAEVLDIKRRNKQILESMQIISVNTGYDFGWKIPKYAYTHKNSKLWSDENSIYDLYEYTYYLFYLYHKQHNWTKEHKSWRVFLSAYIRNHADNFERPKHLTNKFCRQHRQLLLEKNFKFYYKKFPIEAIKFIFLNFIKKIKSFFERDTKKIRATFYCIPCYYTIKDNSLEGRNLIYNKLLDLATVFHQTCNILLNKNYPFPIKVNRHDLTKKQIKELNEQTNKEMTNLKNLL